MTPQEIERTIEFLLQNQAAAEVRQDRTDAQIAELVKQMHDQDRRLSVRIEALAGRIEEITGGLKILKDTCRDLADHARWTDARLRRLEQAEG